MLIGGSINTFFPTWPSVCLSIDSLSATSVSSVTSSGKWLLYLCINLRALNRALANSGAPALYLIKVTQLCGISGKRKMAG